MKGLQGETEETLEGIRLSISTIEKLFQSYGTYCSDLMPTLLPVGAGDGVDPPGPVPSSPISTHGPSLLPGGAAALGVPPLPHLQENGLLLAQAEDHRGDSTTFRGTAPDPCGLPRPWGRRAGPLRVAQGQTPLQRGAGGRWEPSSGALLGARWHCSRRNTRAPVPPTRL